MNSRKGSLERVAVGIASMFGIYWIYACFLQDYLQISDSAKKLIGLFSLYGVGLAVFMCILKKVPTQKYVRRKASLKTIMLCFLLQFTAIMVLSVMVNILTILGLMENSVNINATSPYSLLMLLVFNPIIEEMVFRKLFADKLLQYGELFFMLASSFCFALVHGVSLGIPQIIYTFLLGMIWSYLLVKTGDIRLVIIMHALSNLFGSVIIQALFRVSMILAGLYSMLLMALGATGAVLFCVYKKKVSLDGEERFWRKDVWKDILTNRGILFYIVLTIFMMVAA
ncbi:MAG: CPBP family intramembrane metalloprotease [Lachnospiraceae bacterium]|nr:CPBP family intramembrane metalloprotease [Lachnospiraceae bacterium]